MNTIPNGRSPVEEIVYRAEFIEGYLDYVSGRWHEPRTIYAALAYEIGRMYAACGGPGPSYDEVEEKVGGDPFFMVRLVMDGTFPQTLIPIPPTASLEKCLDQVKARRRLKMLEKGSLARGGSTLRSGGFDPMDYIFPDTYPVKPEDLKSLSELVYEVKRDPVTGREYSIVKPRKPRKFFNDDTN